MRHPENALDDNRICPVTGRVFDHTWSDKDLYDSCIECCPNGYKNIAQQLQELNNARQAAAPSDERR